MKPELLGLNIGGTTCSAAVGTTDGEIILRASWPSEAEKGPDHMIERLIAHSRQLIAQTATPLAVGAAVGGPMDGQKGIVLGPPNLPGWDCVPLAERLADAFGLPVRVEHDAAACALAEYLWGEKPPAERLAYLTCGTGFGVGLIIDGKPYYGAKGTPPEIGHVRYQDDGPEAFGKRGCFEAFSSMPAMQRLAAWRFPVRWGANPPTPKELDKFILQNDPDALEILAIHARAVGDAVALIVDLLGADRVLLGSASRYLGETWVEMVRQRAKSQTGYWTKFEVAPASLGDRLQDCSALAAAWCVNPSRR
jgi:glucokinase